MIKSANHGTYNPNLDEDEPEMLYTGLHHAREPMSFMNLYYFIYWILENYNIDERATQILNTREMWFIPIINPDGYEYNRSIAPNGGVVYNEPLPSSPPPNLGDAAANCEGPNPSNSYQFYPDPDES